MVRIAVLYPNKPGSHFDVEYYLNTHMPLAARLIGPAAKAITVEIGRPGPDGSTPPFAAIGAFTAETMEDFMQAFAPAMGELVADIPNYTDLQPVIQFSDIRLG
jgi:uncharacterized protein (TIGR02118 family)